MAISHCSIFTRVDYPSFDFDAPVQNPTKDLIIKEDLYKRDFYNNPHSNFICPHKTEVISVLHNSSDFCVHRALITTAKGYENTTVSITSESAKLGEVVEKNFSAKQVSKDDDPAFVAEFVTFEQKHQQKRTKMKIGVVYCRQGQVSPQDMFANGRNGDQCSAKFWHFVNILGKPAEITDQWKNYRGDVRAPGRAYYLHWNSEIEVIYHVAPIMNDEETRRLIGNDIAMLFFLDEGKAGFDVSEVDKFGEVPQTYVVVQPVGDKYRLGFFRKKNLDFHPPNPPVGLLGETETRDSILTKLYNGLVMTQYCPPMNRLFWKPRQDTLDGIISKFLPGSNRAPLRKKPSLKNTGRNQVSPAVGKTSLGSLSEDYKLSFVFSDGYSPINSLVFLVASSISYEEPLEQIKEKCSTELGFQQEKVVVIRNGDLVFYIAADPKKVFIIFRGITDAEKEWKLLEKAKKTKITLKKPFSLPGEVQAEYVKYVPLIYEKVESFLNERFYSDLQKIYFAGHGFGGGLAILIGYLFSFTYKEIGGIYAFGSCKVGDPIWAKSYPEWLNARTFRVTHYTDPMSNLPVSTIASSTQATASQWSHVGQHIAPEGDAVTITDANLMRSYYQSLQPAYDRALKAEGGEAAADRLSIRANSIQEGIKNRETIKMQGAFDPAQFDNVRSQSLPATNLVRVPPPVVPPQPQRKAPPPIIMKGETLVSPQIIQQIRNNLFVIVSSVKELKAVTYTDASDKRNEILAKVNKPMENLVIIQGVIASQNELVKELFRSIQHFLEIADHIFLRVGDGLIEDPNQPSLEGLFQLVTPAAKEVISNCDRVIAGK